MSGETHYLIVPGGGVYPLSSLAVQVGGLGDIPVEYQTTQGYGQHGHTVLDWRLAARTLNFQFGVYGRDRRDFWTKRNDLLDLVRPNLNRPVTYRVVLPSGARRDIQGWLRGGPGMESPDRLSFDAAFSLECPDPSFYDPAAHTVTLTSADPEGLGFPIGFPIGFASGFEIARANVAYAGTWRSYPRFVVAGPYDWLRLSNAATGRALKLAVPKLAGESVTLDLTPGALSVTDHNGDPCFDEVEGELTNWYLAEEQTNTILVAAFGHTVGTTSVVLTYYERFIAI